MHCFVFKVNFVVKTQMNLSEMNLNSFSQSGNFGVIFVDIILKHLYVFCKYFSNILRFLSLWYYEIILSLCLLITGLLNFIANTFINRKYLLLSLLTDLHLQWTGHFRCSPRPMLTDHYWESTPLLQPLWSLLAD